MVAYNPMEIDMTETTQIRTNYSFEHFDFNMQDKRGREIGAKIMVWDAEFVPAEKWGCMMPEGKYLAFEPHATRNGANYGACQRTQYFATEGERAVAINTYLAKAMARAAKI